MRPTRAHYVLFVVALAVLSTLVGVWVRSAAARLAELQAAKGKAQGAAVASAADEGYCTGALKQILRRVLTSCGLLKGGSQRGCQPVQARSVAAMSGEDFNALFVPLADRAAIVQFDQDSANLDPEAVALLDTVFADQRGASYFLVVSRASPEGPLGYNRELSRKRAEAVLAHVKSKFSDPDLDQEVGLLWLGAEFAQLDRDFCRWKRSRPQEACSTAHLNRSAFIAWIDCRL
jgi:outer membrane protein OmpA-like peptidoglycan-associated protein